MRKIDLMIIGAQKSGTTSLLRYLGEHPGLVAPFPIEFTWFNAENDRNVDLGTFMERRYPPLREGRTTGHVAKLANMYRLQPALALLHDHFPACHLAFVVRDPVSRAYSAYRMACADGGMTFDPGFMGRLIREAGPGVRAYDLFVEYGRYADALDMVFGIFPKDQVHVFRFEDLKRDPQGVCDPLFNVLGLEAHELLEKEKIHNETARPRSGRLASAITWMRSESNPIKRAVRSVVPYTTYLRVAGAIEGVNRSTKSFPAMEPDALRDWGRFFHDHDARLASMTGLDLSGWTSQRKDE